MYKKLVVLLLLLIPGVTLATTVQDDWIEALHQCESQGRDYITILDTNNKYSYGGLMFQLGTFMSFGKKYNILPDELTDKEGLLLIHRYSIQKAIAQAMLDDGLDYHWKNCRDKKIGPYPTSAVDS